MVAPLSVILHGGAGKFNSEYTAKKLPFLKEALDAAWDSLIKGKPAEFAVAAALRVMEGSEYFNAGYGGFPNVNGIVLLDLGLMRGNRDFISLVNVRRVKFPSAIALDMMEDHRSVITIWTHELMTQLDNAPDFVKERYGLVATHDDLIPPFIRELMRRRETFELDQEESPHGTVGCVVRDAEGHLAAGTSTGGVSFKTNGRIGDTPIIGSGVFADNEIGALSTTGHGETFLLSVISGFVIAEARAVLRKNPRAFEEQPQLLQDLLDSEVKEMARKSPGHGGAILFLPPRGLPSYSFNSEMVSLAMRCGDRQKITHNQVLIARSNAPAIAL